MSRNCVRRARTGRPNSSSSFGFEILEDRRVLSATADIVFLVDESASVSDGIRSWLSANIAQFDATLRNNGIDVRYGLVGYRRINQPQASAQNTDHAIRSLRNFIAGLLD